MADRGFFSEVDAPGIARPVPISRTPIRLASAGDEGINAAPAIGAHSREILQELGYDTAAIEKLISTGIVRSADGST